MFYLQHRVQFRISASHVEIDMCRFQTYMDVWFHVANYSLQKHSYSICHNDLQKKITSNVSVGVHGIVIFDAASSEVYCRNCYFLFRWRGEVRNLLPFRWGGGGVRWCCCCQWPSPMFLAISNRILFLLPFLLISIRFIGPIKVYPIFAKCSCKKN